MDLVIACKLVIAMAMLVVGSVTDWRKREAPDWCWGAIGLAGLVFMGASIIENGNLAYLIMVPIMGALLLDLFLDWEALLGQKGGFAPIAIYVVSALLLIYIAFTNKEDAFLWGLMMAPVMYAIFVLMYYLDVIKGGADAKALISLAIMFPTYPKTDGFPIISTPEGMTDLMLPFPLLVLFMAAILTLAVPIALLFLNVAHGDLKFPAMLFGYRSTVQKARETFVWPMETVEEDGSRKVRLFPRAEGDDPDAELSAQLDALEASGAESIWVTPKVPFLIPITAGLAAAFVIGNVFFLLV